MSKFNDLIKNLCPNGVEFKKFGEVINISRACLQTILTRKVSNENKQTQENYHLIFRNKLEFSDCSLRSEKNVQPCFEIFTNSYHNPKDFSYWIL